MMMTMMMMMVLGKVIHGFEGIEVYQMCERKTDLQGIGWMKVKPNTQDRICCWLIPKHVDCQLQISA